MATKTDAALGRELRDYWNARDTVEARRRSLTEVHKALDDLIGAGFSTAALATFKTEIAGKDMDADATALLTAEGSKDTAKDGLNKTFPGFIKD